VTTDVVTGAFSYTGAHIARLLLAAGRRVRSLSRSPDPSHPLAPEVEFALLDFSRPDALADALAGAETFYNTYWMRFPRGGRTFDHAVENTRVLIEAAKRAGVRRVVQITVANAAADSPVPYFRAKAAVERIVAGCGIPHAIVRPTLTFGPDDILVNDIAWTLRRFPVFVVPGHGRYRVQPVAVEDVAQLAVELGRGDDDVSADAAGHDVFEFDELVSIVAAAVGRRRRLVHLPVPLAVVFARGVGLLLRDVPLTRDEVRALELGLLVSNEPAAGRRRFPDFVAANADALGRTYASELGRNFRPYAAV
jgi:uncharacterized protein YbjT (DUF2867 family)